MSDPDPRQILARHLRSLREERWSAKKVKQAQLAKALSEGAKGHVSVPLISSWESARSPKVPPDYRVADLATFYSSPRSFDGHVGHLLRLDEMTVQERAERDKLLEELTRLRSEALDVPDVTLLPVARADNPQEIVRSLRAGPYRYREGDIVTVVCAELPQKMLRRMPYTDNSDPDFIELNRYSELDSLFEVHGHLRAANPTNRIHRRLAHELKPDDYTGHLVTLGGVDWNETTRTALTRLQLPVRQLNDWEKPDGAYFEVTEEDGRKVAYRPLLDEVNGREVLREDVALFARGVSPYNQKRFVTICDGMYGRGTYGAVRALTDQRFRDRNAEYIENRFAGRETFCLLTRVTVENGVTLTPDWTLPETLLFEWPPRQ